MGLKKIKLFYIFDTIILILTFLGIYQAANRAGFDFNYEYSADGQIGVFGNADNTLPQGFNIIRKINQHKISSIEEIEFIFDSHEIGESVKLEVGSGSIVKEYSLILKGMVDLRLLFLRALIGLLFFFTGVFVIRFYRKQDQVGMVFHFLVLVLAFDIMVEFGRFNLYPESLFISLRCFSLMSSCFFPVLFIHFSFIFPAARNNVYRIILRVFYIFSIILTVALSYYFIQSINPVSIETFRDFTQLYKLVRYYLAAALIWASVNFIYAYVSSGNEQFLKQLRWIFIGLTCGPVLYVFFHQLPEAIVSYALIPEEILLIIVLIPLITFTIAIVRYNVLDIDYIFNKSTVYIIVVFVVMVMYFLTLFYVNKLVGEYSNTLSLYLSTILAVVISILFEPIRNIVQKLVDKFFFRLQYNSKTIQKEIDSKLGLSLNKESLFNDTRDFLIDLFNIEYITFYYNVNGIWDCSFKSNIKPGKQANKYLDELAKESELMMFANKNYVESELEFGQLDSTQLGDNTEILFPAIKDKNKTCIFLAIGKKKSGFKFFKDDIDILFHLISRLKTKLEKLELQKKLILKDAENEKLEELNKLKSYFVASVSHDLQTPLTSIRLFTEIIQEKESLNKVEIGEYLQIIQNETSRLSRLIDNILEFSKIERGTKKYYFSRFNLVQTIDDVLNIMKYQLLDGGFDLDIDISDKEIFIEADKDSVFLVFINLISNAIKYSLNEKHLSIRATRNANTVTVDISDRGLGIDKEEQKKVFETFYRSANESTQSVSGAGLGLTLVKHIIDGHKGDIRLKSKSGEGTCFSIVLPIGCRNE